MDRPAELRGETVLGPCVAEALPPGCTEGWVVRRSLTSKQAEGWRAKGWRVIPSGPHHVLIVR